MCWLRSSRCQTAKRCVTSWLTFTPLCAMDQHRPLLSAVRSAVRSSKALVPTTGVDSAFTALECSSRAAHLGGVLASARCVCVLMAAVALTDGVPGTAESWADLLSGCRRHGTVGDGNRMVRLQWSAIRRTGRDAGSALGDRGGPARRPGHRRAEAPRPDRRLPRCAGRRGRR